MYIYIHLYLYLYIYIYIYIFECVYTYTYLCIHIYMYMYIHMYTCIHYDTSVWTSVLVWHGCFAHVWYECVRVLPYVAQIRRKQHNRHTHRHRTWILILYICRYMFIYTCICTTVSGYCDMQRSIIKCGSINTIGPHIATIHKYTYYIYICIYMNICIWIRMYIHIYVYVRLCQGMAMTQSYTHIAYVHANVAKSTQQVQGGEDS